MSDANWEKVAQEAEKVRDMALEAQASATIARCRAEQERDGLREQLAAEIRAKACLGQILEAARSEAIMLQREHAAILADANAARVKAEQERDQARQEVAAVKRQLELVSRAFHTRISQLQSQRPTACDFCPAAHSGLCRHTEQSCDEIVAQWAAQQVAREGGGK
jgi:hypothetical protein